MTTHPDRPDAEQFHPVTEDQLAEQLAYYSSRAGEYDDWWLRRGAFDQGAAANERWLREADQVRTVLESLDLGQDVLELAPGTGTWSVRLAPRVSSLLLVDGSAQMLAHNPVAGQGNVRTVIADLFVWDTDQRFDTVVFTFWISHVPRERLEGFFRSVSGWLRAGGRVFFVDDVPAAKDEPHVAGSAGQTMVRRLDSGRSATIVKNFYRREELVSAADAAGIELDVQETETHFQYATGLKR
jgi:cyclopropane fatty-acyl-phospholipid synthase-like methyltransferase